MTEWIAIVPFKLVADRKTRLATKLSPDLRLKISEIWFRHVVDILKQSPSISTVMTLMDGRPPVNDVTWLRDEGRGLNAELKRVRTIVENRYGPFCICARRGIVIVHADLPFLSVSDVEALIAAASGSVAFATDKNRSGTNAIALMNHIEMRFSFGPDSLALHRIQAPTAAIVDRFGLAFDIDTPSDFDMLKTNDRANRHHKMVIKLRSRYHLDFQPSVSRICP